ncbi:MAG: ABC transporter permease subunit [Clostridiaceae bacterium]|nr:ABC transporter permease subunit [Clostridiaceae bacterium]
MTIVKHELKMNLKSLLIWSITIGIMAFAFMLMFPLLKDSLKGMEDQIKSMKEFSAAFDLDKLSVYTPMGYYGTQVGYILSLGGSMFAALLGTGMLSKEEGGHTAEFLLSTPISRGNVVLQKMWAMLITIILFELAYIILILISFILIGEPIAGKEFWLYHVAQFCMHLEIACICFCISAFLKKASIGLGLALSLSLYFLDIIEKTISKLEVLKYITPFTYAGAGDIMTNGRIQGDLLLIGITVSILCVTISYVKYVKKDIAA